MNKVYAWPAVVATSLTATILYIFCAIFVLISPEKSVWFFGSIFHGIDLTKITNTTITIPSFLLGLVVTILLTALVTFLIVFFYNVCLEHCKRKNWVGG